MHGHSNRVMFSIMFHCGNTVRSFCTINRKQNWKSEAGKAHTYMEIKLCRPASVVIADWSNLFPLCRLEHQMVNVAGVALHHLGNSEEKHQVNKSVWSVNEHFLKTRLGLFYETRLYNL